MEELEKMVEACYKDGFKFVTYAEDDYEMKRSAKKKLAYPFY